MPEKGVNSKLLASRDNPIFAIIGRALVAFPTCEKKAPGLD